MRMVFISIRFLRRGTGKKGRGHVKEAQEKYEFGIHLQTILPKLWIASAPLIRNMFSIQIQA